MHTISMYFCHLFKALYNIGNYSITKCINYNVKSYSMNFIMVSINLRFSFRVGDSHVVLKMTKKEITSNQKLLYKKYQGYNLL